MAEASGYTGVTNTPVDVGFTSADGYTGVIRSEIASGYTGAVPTAASVTSSTIGSEPPSLAAGSPYDPVTRSASGAPGGDVALAMADAPPSVVDLAEVREAREQPASDSAEASLPDPAGAPAAAVAQADAFVLSYRRLRSRLEGGATGEPEPPVEHRAPDERVGTYLAAAPLHAHRLIDWAAARADRQIDRILGPSGAGELTGAFVGGLVDDALDTVGGAYLAGFTQDMAHAGVHAVTGSLALALDPLGSGMTAATQLMDAFVAHLDAGESRLRALDSTLDPFTRLSGLLQQPNQMNQARDAERAGHHADALRIARSEGRRVAAASLGLVDAATAIGTAAALTGRVSRVARGRPLGPFPARFEPFETARPAGPLRIHPTFPQVPILDTERLRLAREVARRRLTGEQQLAAQRLGAPLPVGAAETRLAVANPIYHALQHATALELQRAHPDWAIIEQARVTRIVSEHTILEPADVPVSYRGGRVGRILDVLPLEPNGGWWDVEHKTPSAILRSVSSTGGLTKAFKRGYSDRPLPAVQIRGALRGRSELAMERSRTADLVDAARRIGGVIEFEGTGLDGSTVRVRVRPDQFLGSQFGAYGDLPN